VRELSLGQLERRGKVLTEERSLGSNFEDSLVNSLLVSGLGGRESSLLLQNIKFMSTKASFLHLFLITKLSYLLTLKESLVGLGSLLEVSIVDLFINL
jgi:hypothetical protein